MEWSWAEKHRGRPARKPPPSARTGAMKVLKSLSGQTSPGVRDLESNWSEIVGEGLAKLSRPEKFQAGQAGSTLVIKARGPAATLIEAQNQKIRDRVARYSGKPVARLKIVQGPLHEDLSVKSRRQNRIIKVQRLDGRTKKLDALMDEWAEAVARDELRPPKSRK